MNENLFTVLEELRKLLLQYLQTRIALVRTRLLIRLVKAISLILGVLLAGFIVLLVVIFLGIALGYWLGAWMGSYALGFLAVAVLYILIFMLVYVFRRQIFLRPIANLVIHTFLDENDEH
ncbi:putative superfamily III holin-X [Thermoflavifilum aggregans]|uniref:Putative superfamily III holin-X n=1 Tax=Thermoflavifilum aggregans TaxID=454188 RepID=A0A2M9CRV5_9BACT|nr:phage holin family protein [Thermoflavifilum aggregans]PJJ74591.1 putative superfamily III holin-X [Thermoflavifilum aggregans]